MKKRYEDYVWMVKGGKVIPVEPEQVNNHEWVKKQRKWLRNLPGSGFAYLEVAVEEAQELFRSIEENFPRLSPELALNLVINYKVDVRIQAALILELLIRRWAKDFDESWHLYERNWDYRSIEAEAQIYAAVLQLCLNGRFDRLMIDQKFDYDDHMVWKRIRFRQ